MFRISLLLVLFAGSATAQSFYPNLAGMRYCELRSLGVNSQESIRIAIAEFWSSSRVSPQVNVNGRLTSLDQIDFYRWTNRCK